MTEYIPDEMKNTVEMIREAAIAAVISGAIALATAIYSRVKLAAPDVAALLLLDVAVTWALAYGIYRKSRICAVAMTFGFAFSKAFSLVRNPAMDVLDVVIVIGFLYFFIQGIFGTFRWHRHAARYGRAAVG